jgi:plastocyanin
MGMLVMLSLKSQQTTTITASGTTFSPADITVHPYDIVRFSTGSAHPVLQVSADTWNVNGSAGLPGGFSYPQGTGDFIPTAPGTYYYICTAHIDVGMKGKINVSAATGITKPELEKQFNVYPVPANDFLNFRKNSPLPVSELRILDITGRTLSVISNPVQSDEEVKIDISDLVKGIYFLNVKFQEGVVSGKFLKSE